MNTQFSFELTAIAGAVILFVVWLVRLEAKILYLEKDLKDTKLNHDSMEKTMWDKFELMRNTLVEIQKSIARIEGKLESSKD